MFRLSLAFDRLQSITQIMRVTVADCIQNLKSQDNPNYMLLANEIRFFLHCSDTNWGWLVWFIEMKNINPDGYGH